MSKWSSYKDQQLLVENWRKFLHTEDLTSQFSATGGMDPEKYAAMKGKSKTAAALQPGIDELDKKILAAEQEVAVENAAEIDPEDPYAPRRARERIQKAEKKLSDLQQQRQALLDKIEGAGSLDPAARQAAYVFDGNGAKLAGIIEKILPEDDVESLRGNIFGKLDKHFVDLKPWMADEIRKDHQTRLLMDALGKLVELGKRTDRDSDTVKRARSKAIEHIVRSVDSLVRKGVAMKKEPVKYHPRTRRAAAGAADMRNRLRRRSTETT